MDNLIGYIATGVVSLGVGILLKYLEPKTKLVYWLPHNFFFNLKEENVSLRTDSVTIQNLGRKSAEDIEIIHKTKPDFFQFSPAVPFGEDTTPSGEHVIKIKSLGPKEYFNLQLLSHKTEAVLLNIRSKDGPAVAIPIRLQRAFPKWFYILATLLFLVGVGFSAFWIIRAVIFLSKNIGIV